MTSRYCLPKFPTFRLLRRPLPALSDGRSPAVWGRASPGGIITRAHRHSKECACQRFASTAASGLRITSEAPLVEASRETVKFAGLPQEDIELVESLQLAVKSLGEGAAESEHPLVELCDRVVTAYRDKAALLKRDWTDEMFQEGEDMNEERVMAIEAKLATFLSNSGAGLDDGGNLGSALDLVGVYMKNYKLDKADSVLSRCGPYVSARGGVWMVKWLNHVSTVRMKQSRHLEALEMLYDLELYSPYSAEEAPEFFETLNRNLAWALKAMGRIDEALLYFYRMAKASRTHKGTHDWFDCWDIGKLAATRAFRDQDMPGFFRGRHLIEEALRMHMESEPDDFVMRAKVHDSLAECFLVVDEFARAEEHYAAAYNLLLRTVGKNSPLFGRQAKHSASLKIAQGQHADALPFLGEALAVEASKDSVKLDDVRDLVDMLVNAQQRAASEDAVQPASNHMTLRGLRKNLKSKGLDDSKEYGVLCHKMSLVYLHEHLRDPAALRRAQRLAKTSVQLLRRHAHDTSSAEWLRIAELHLRMLTSTRLKS